jgi:hypothetical protein
LDPDFAGNLRPGLLVPALFPVTLRSSVFVLIIVTDSFCDPFFGCVLLEMMNFDLLKVDTGVNRLASCQRETREGNRDY